MRRSGTGCSGLPSSGLSPGPDEHLAATFLVSAGSQCGSPATLSRAIARSIEPPDGAVQGRSCADLADVRPRAERCCREVAGQQVHGTTRQIPRVVFEDQERTGLLLWDGVP